MIGRPEEALHIRRDVYSKRSKLLGEEDSLTLSAANNYAASLVDLRRFEEAKVLLRKMMPVARRVLGVRLSTSLLGENDDIMLRMRWYYANALYRDGAATLDDLREAVTTLDETEQTTRRVFGGAHPLTAAIEGELRNARAALAAHEAPPPGTS